MARGGGDRVDGPVEVLDAHEHRRSDPDGRAAGAEHVGEFTVDAVVVVDEFRRWFAEPGGAGVDPGDQTAPGTAPRTRLGPDLSPWE